MVNRLLASACAATMVMLGTAAAAQQEAQPVKRSAFLGNLETRFAQMDSNHDGQLNNAEIGAQVARELQQTRQAMTNQLAASFKRLDTNKDGQLSQQEFMAAAPPIKSNETPGQLLQQLDANHDGKVSLDEFRAPQVARFNRADTNHDGMVTPAEARAAAGQN